MNNRTSFKTTTLVLAIATCLMAFSNGAIADQATPQTTPQTATSQTDFLSTIPWDAEYDVVVLGYGFAGGAAAISAADKGSKVLLSEKAPKGKEGGNSKYSAQGAMFIWPEVSDEQALKYFQAL